MPGPWVMVSGLNKNNVDVILNTSQVDVLPPNQFESTARSDNVQTDQSRFKSTVDDDSQDGGRKPLDKKLCTNSMQKFNDLIDEYIR